MCDALGEQRSALRAFERSPFEYGACRATSARNPAVHFEATRQQQRLALLRVHWAVPTACAPHPSLHRSSGFVRHARNLLFSYNDSFRFSRASATLLTSHLGNRNSHVRVHAALPICVLPSSRLQLLRESTASSIDVGQRKAAAKHVWHCRIELRSNCRRCSVQDATVFALLKLGFGRTRGAAASLVLP
jgi:hypothetical protein